MKKIVVYYTLEGNTKYVAEKIAEYSGADLLEIKTVKPYKSKGFMKYLHGGGDVMKEKKPKLQPYKFDGEKYDEVILAMPTWAACFPPPIRTFVDENREMLQKKEISAYAGHRGAGADQCIEKLRVFIGVEKISRQLTLIDPKDKHEDEKDEAIKAFCV